MPNVLQTAYSGEGPTDERFLGPIIRRTLEELVLDAVGQIEVLPPVWLQVAKGEEDIITTVRRAQGEGYQLLCLHADADNRGSDDTYDQSLRPAIEAVANDPTITLQIIPLIPERTTEAWMLADLPALKEELLTDLSSNELGLSRDVERIADPKENLREAVRRANQGKGAHLQSNIADLYSSLGEIVDLNLLAGLPSYQQFRERLRVALVNINYLR